LVLNAAAALWIAGAAPALEDAVSLAAEQIDSGRAKSLLERFVAVSQELARDL